MATVVLQYAGQAVGTFLGGSLGGVVGRAIGAVAGNYIDQALFGPGARKVEGPRLNDLRVMASTEGASIPRLWGRMRVAGEVIWATHFEEVTATSTEKSSSKGGGGGSATKVTEYSYFANFAVALCEGEIDRIGRVWADGKDFDIGEATVRVYTGSETQNPDSLILAKEGAELTPAYRGVAYVVFERLPIGPFGNRLPQLTFEVFHSVGGAEDEVRAVNIIPGATEFGYDTEIVTREPEPGVTEPENAHASAASSDWSMSLDQLTATCRNLKGASLVVAWFGTDLRCGTCEVKPGVEVADKITDPESWIVNGIARADAYLVSSSGGSPAFGGTPSDASVIRAIQDLKARGLKTTFYPFILMDVPAGNGLVDPYGGTEQSVYPWRGRITSSMAPGLPGTPDGTVDCAREIADFVGSAVAADFAPADMTVTYTGQPEWSYRRMVLHYAHLCALAGGVDTFLIGSELRGLTTLRGSADSFPFVDALVALAAEVKAILPGAEISYAADWSEYFGYHPADGSGDVYFHLDALWSSPDVDFIGIDNYMPLADWRDGRQHADALAGFRSIYDLAYLKSNIAGGEGYDWYYANGLDREAQIRSPITDGTYGKHWIFRYKDLVGWWSNPHVARISGVEVPSPTNWMPQSKPIRFTEAGCPAIDKGANQPNAFVDVKSSESQLPYFSRGNRDDLIQAHYVTALGQYWSTVGDHNPISSVYGGPMLDADDICFWAWDARPYPQFPARADVWADGGNYTRGHWLNGRIGAVPLGALITSVCAASGFFDIDAGAVEGLVDGFVIDRPMSVRAALEGIIGAYGIDVVESAGVLRFSMRRQAIVIPASSELLVETDADASLFALTRAQETELPAAMKLSYVESALDYRPAAVETKHVGGSSQRDIHFSLPCAVNQAEAKVRADVAMQEIWASRESANLSLPLSFLQVEAGDVVELSTGGATIPLLVDEMSESEHRAIRAHSYDVAIYDAPEAPSRGIVAAKPAIYGKPDAVIMDLPIAATPEPHAPWMAASAKPWPGSLAVYRKTGPATFDFNRTIDRKATKGHLLDDLLAGRLNVFDRSNAFTVKLDAGALSSISDEELLGGANAAAVGSDATGWEILQFANAELVAGRTYRISRLLRGQSASEPEMLPIRVAGERFVLLNKAVVQPVLSLAASGLPTSWKIGPAQYDVGRQYVSVAHQGKLLGLRPLSPCSLRASRDGGDVIFSWLRRTRIDGDSWDVAEVPLGEETESYVASVMNGAAIMRSTSVTAQQYRYPAADIAGDFGMDPGEFTIRIAQLSAAYGPGAVLERTIHV
ncbi:MAG TPA: glycoside hydrolase/phage tail family protein [Aestuariivirga sp.]|nr:glycoside hydrolase/phage tail family protein [Aestuariivirga sp.]